MPVSIVERIAKLVKDLPALPAVAQQALALLTDSATEPEALESVLSRDPALALKVLRQANSAYYRRGREVTTLSGAVVLLGFKSIHTMVLSSAVHRVMSSAGAAAAALWEHSFACGVAGRQLAQAVGRPPDAREEAFLAGLFHDVGKGVIAARFPGVYGVPLGISGEMEQLGFHHGHLGHVLLTLWDIPTPLRLAVAGLHDPQPEDGLARLIAVADWLAWDAAPGIGAECPQTPQLLIDDLRVTDSILDDIRGHVLDLLAEEKSQT